MKSAVNFAVASFAGLIAACVSKPAEKQILAEPVAQKILALCNANPGKVIRVKNGLPYLTITVSPAEREGGRNAPTIKCVREQLRPYRYDSISF